MFVRCISTFVLTFHFILDYLLTITKDSVVLNKYIKNNNNIQICKLQNTVGSAV